MPSNARRDFLSLIGAGALASGLPAPLRRDAAAAVAGGQSLPFTPVRLPHPLPVYATHDSFLPTGTDGAGRVSPAEPSAELARYTVVDDVVVPPEFERYPIVAWGDRVFPDAGDYVGYDHAYTGYVPVRGSEEGWLVVNHGAIAYPFHEASPGAPVECETGRSAFAPGMRSFDSVIGFALPTVAPGASPGTQRMLVGESLYNSGVSVLRIRRRTRGGQFVVVPRAVGSRRIHGLSGLAINAGRADAYAGVTRWSADGADPLVAAHQRGDTQALAATGPAAADVFVGVDGDGLGERIIGTFASGSGATTPWGTVLSAEGNIQGNGAFAAVGSPARYPSRFPAYVGVTEAVKSNGTQVGYTAHTAGALFGLVGEKYGWIVETDPRRADGPAALKHTALGRFRHANAAIRCEAGRPLVVYMGDARRGGHTWKFVSAGIVQRVDDPANSRLLERGTLYVARYEAGSATVEGSGVWIALAPSTPVDPVDPASIAPMQPARLGGVSQPVDAVEAAGLVHLPRRIGIAGERIDGGLFAMTTLNRATQAIPPGGTRPQSYLDQYRLRPDRTRRTLADFYATPGAIFCDAYPAANLVGGTPCARPGDIEIDARTRDVFIAMTDGAAGADGCPDARIFTVRKVGTAADAAQPFGGLYRLAEDSDDGSGTTFTWSRFAAAGEAGADGGAGFANVDALSVDPQGRLWCATSIASGVHNGIGDGPIPTSLPVDHADPGAAESIAAVFGSNGLFCIPTRNAWAGTVLPFAHGPVRATLSGPTFVSNTLLLSVRHPGRDSPIGASIRQFERRGLEMLRLDGSGTFNQDRRVPSGSAWPSVQTAMPGGTSASAAPSGVRPAPRSATLGIRRRDGGSFA
jgi:hypothetical protein